MADPIGENTYKGLGVPLVGDSLIKQLNPNNAILSLEHSSANTGRFLLGRDDVSSASSGDDAYFYSSRLGGAVFDIDAAGGFRAVSGTTVKIEMNTSGVWSGSTKVINSSGNWIGGQIKNVVPGTTAVTNATTFEDSGNVFVMSSKNDTSMVYTLPKNPPAGTFYDFIFYPQDVTSDAKIVSTLDSSADIVVSGLSSNVSSAACITPFTTEYAAIRLTALTSIRWYGEPYIQTCHFTSDAKQNEDFDHGRWAIGDIVG